MNFGQDYAKTYDAFYRGKDYSGEARFVLDRIGTIAGDGPLRILDLGCGTGIHDVELVQAGHQVTGVDRSAEMLSHAEARRALLPSALQSRLSFQTGDARQVRLGSGFDVVVSLFHVISYMAGEGDADCFLETAKAHLKPGGLFLFDFWYGPAVVADPPGSRERLVEEDSFRIRRRTIPHWDRARDIVRIVFEVEKTSLATGDRFVSSEEHVMRYYFEDGLRAALTRHGFETLEFAEWLTATPARTDTFGVYALAKLL